MLHVLRAATPTPTEESERVQNTPKPESAGTRSPSQEASFLVRGCAVLREILPLQGSQEFLVLFLLLFVSLQLFQNILWFNNVIFK